MIRALSSATTTFTATSTPKSRSNGYEERASTANPPPDRGETGGHERPPDARHPDIHRGGRIVAGGPLLATAGHDQRRELGAGGDDQRTGQRRHEAEFHADDRMGRVREDVGQG